MADSAACAGAAPLKDAHGAVRLFDSFPGPNSNGRSRSFHSARLRSGNALAREIANDGSLTAVYGEGGGCTLDIYGEASAIFIPISGSLRVATSSFASELCRGATLVTAFDPRINAVGHARARWVALLGGHQAWWRRLQAQGLGVSVTQLLPARTIASRNLQRHAIALARAERTPELDYAATATIDDIIALQAPLFDAVSRCPGRTHAKRLSVFLRLQRVRNFICSNCDEYMDNRTLARMANFAPCHFLRMFTQAFGETPHSLLVNERLQRARWLLRSTDFAIAEIALACGFENRCSFARLLHQRFGTTASEMRRSMKCLANGATPLLKPGNVKTRFRLPPAKLDM